MTNTKRFTCTALLSLAMMVTLSPLGRTATLKKAPEPSDPTAFVTDQPADTSPDAEEVAREVLRLQEELGGSIVTDYLEPAHPKTPSWSPPQNIPYSLPPQPTWVRQQQPPVSALRETAWRLDQSAYLLESLDLYSQADALRTTATRLRQDARKIKSKQNPRESTADTK